MSARALASRLASDHYHYTASGKVNKFTRKRGLRRARRLPIEVNEGTAAIPSDWEQPVLIEHNWRGYTPSGILVLAWVG